MQIRVLYFAVFRERIGSDGETLDLEPGADVTSALALLAERHPSIRAFAGRFQTAVNQEMVAGDTVLRQGDELALIPPVAGGSATSDRAHARISDQPLSLDRVVAAVSSPECGGLVTFTGAVRRHNQGHAVERLEYEAYVAMAEKVMAELCAAIEAEIPGIRIAVEHRIGVLTIGEAAVVIAAAAPHRAEAFAACRALIDRLKESVPIWKKEVSPEGEEWIGLGP